MLRTPAIAATVLALIAAPALAAEPAAPAPAEAPRKATPEQRLEAERLDPLGRAAFWAREVQVDGRDIHAAVALSQALRALGRHEDAAAAAERALVVAPGSFEALMEVARAHLGRGQGFYAIEPARKAQGLNPRDWRPVSLLAVAYEQARRDEEALAAHRQALSMAPDEPGVLANFALYQAAHGRIAEAETLLRKAAAQPGATAQVRQNLALVLGLQGRLDEAEQIARRDLPPETVANNLNYLKAATAGAGARTWEDLR